MPIPTLEEAQRFMRDSRRTVPPPTDAARVEKFRRENLRLKLVPPDTTDAELLAILKDVDQLPIDPVRTR